MAFKSVRLSRQLLSVPSSAFLVTFREQRVHALFIYCCSMAVVIFINKVWDTIMAAKQQHVMICSSLLNYWSYLLYILTYYIKILDVFFRTKNLVKTNIIFDYQSSLRIQALQYHWYRIVSLLLKEKLCGSLKISQKAYEPHKCQ